jgi:hypothetical protein
MEFILKLNPVLGSSTPMRCPQIAKGVDATGIYIIASMFKKELSIRVNCSKVMGSNTIF